LNLFNIFRRKWNFVYCNWLTEVSNLVDDGTLRRAIVRSLEIIGEASKHTPAELKSKFPLIEWKMMAGMRDRLIHHYFGIDYETVYSTVKNDLPPLKEWIDILLAAEK
jgi:uncharacterized protein with HEPN domain